jgi:hypothetical protein
MNKILVCTDGSAYSFVCYDYAAWMAHRTGAALDVLYVSDLRQFEVPMVADLSGSLGVQPYQAVLGKLQEFEQERAKAILEQARKHLAAKTPPVVATFTHTLSCEAEMLSIQWLSLPELEVQGDVTAESKNLMSLPSEMLATWPRNVALLIVTSTG